MVPHSDIITQLLVFRSFIPLNLKLSSLCLSSVLTTKICVPSKAWPPLQRMRECCFLKPIYNLGPICPPPGSRFSRDHHLPLHRFLFYFIFCCRGCHRKRSTLIALIAHFWNVMNIRFKGLHVPHTWSLGRIWLLLHD